MIPPGMRDLVIRLPLTAILEQDEWWRTGDGMPIKLTTMDPEHRANTLAFLRRRADSLQIQHWWWLFGDAPDDVFDEAHRLEIEEPAEEWLQRRPLVQELTRLVLLDGSVEGELVGVELER